MSGFGIASEKVPTMKSLDSDKKAGKSGAVEEATANDNNGFFKDNAKIDFSNVKVEPLFEEEVGGVVTVTLGVTLTLLGLKVIGSDDDLPQIGNDENVA